MEVSYSAFEQLLTEKESLFISSVEAQFVMEDELIQAYRKTCPRSKVKFPNRKEAGRWLKIKSLTQKSEEYKEVFEEIVARHHQALDKEIARVQQEKERVDTLLDEMAAQLTPRPGEEWIKVGELSDFTYASMGWGKNKYARKAAEFDLLEAQKQGIEVKIVEVEVGGGKRNRYEQWVKCLKVDFEIAKRRRQVSIKEALQWCWNNGVNPRVFNPFLPHGLEEKLGVSFLAPPSLS